MVGAVKATTVGDCWASSRQADPALSQQERPRRWGTAAPCRGRLIPLPPGMKNLGHGGPLRLVAAGRSHAHPMLTEHRGPGSTGAAANLLFLPTPGGESLETFSYITGFNVRLGAPLRCLLIVSYSDLTLYCGWQSVVSSHWSLGHLGPWTHLKSISASVSKECRESAAEVLSRPNRDKRFRKCFEKYLRRNLPRHIEAKKCPPRDLETQEATGLDIL